MPSNNGSEPGPVPDSRTTIVLSERLAVVETKVGGLKEDTAVIRNSMHSINNEMSRFVAVEERCAAALTLLSGQMTEHTKQISELSARLTEIALLRAKGEGVWFAVCKLALIIAALGGGMAAAVSIVVKVWL